MRHLPSGVDRSEEIRHLFRLSVEDMVRKSDGHLVVKRTIEELFDFAAERLVGEFRASMGRAGPTAFILPVGPVEPYPLMAERINRDRIDLSRCWFFFMDEYCDDEGHPVPESHPLSFRRTSREQFFDRIDRRLRMPDSQVVFPSPNNLERLPAMMEAVGGIELCYGGLGIHGHVAFNEPAVGVKDSGPRVVELNEYTRTIDATRSGVGGNLINFPRRAITIGFRQIMGARKVFLISRNAHAAMDWANTVLRLAVLGKPGDDYPATHLRGHGGYLIAADYATASAPRIIL